MASKIAFAVLVLVLSAVAMADRKMDRMEISVSAVVDAFAEWAGDQDGATAVSEEGGTFAVSRTLMVYANADTTVTMSGAGGKAGYRAADGSVLATTIVMSGPQGGRADLSSGPFVVQHQSRVGAYRLTLCASGTLPEGANLRSARCESGAAAGNGTQLPVRFEAEVEQGDQVQTYQCGVTLTLSW